MKTASDNPPQLPLAKESDELRLSARLIAGPSRSLHTVSGIEDHGPPKIPHNRKTAHVDDEVVISKRRAALR